jgi:CelD/BcsL family acetyltransferase involved in cellulose biosynthesis
MASARVVPGASSGLTVEVVRTVSGIEKLRAEYTQLQTTTGNDLPFALQEWHVAWCRHFLREKPSIVDQPIFHVVRTKDGNCVAILPFILTRRRVGGLSVASVAPLGADPAITEIRASLVQPGYEDRVAGTVSQRLNQRGDWDWIQWIGRLDPFDKAIANLRTLQWQPIAPCYILDLPATWEEFRAGLKRNIRESLRHCYNSLKRDGHEFTLQVAAEPDPVAQAVERLFVLHTLRAGMSGTVVHPNRFAGVGLRRFVVEVCNALAARDVVRMFELQIGGKIVASRIGFVVGGSLYLYYSGFDPEWSKYGVMTTTMAEAIKYAIAHGLKTVNLSPGNDVSKTRWGPREFSYYSASEHSGRLRSRIVRQAYVKAQSGDGLGGWLLRRLIPGQRDWN